MHDERKENLKQQLLEIYPYAPHTVLCDLHHLLVGNANHIPTVKKKREGVAYDHQEVSVGIGTGFDWMHRDNFMLIVNPNDPNLIPPIRTSLKVLLSNLENKRINADDGVVIMIATSYRSIEDRNHAYLKARDLANLVYQVLIQDMPKLLEYDIKFLVGSVNQETRLFESLSSVDGPEFIMPSIPKELMGMNKTAEYLISHNTAKSQEFTSPYQKDLRTLYRRDHPTEIMALKCMDGRMNLPIITGVPMGVIIPARNLGAIFSPGWKGFYDEIKLWKLYAIKERKQCLILTTYHYSQRDIDHPDSEHKYGCAGHGYDIEKAKQNALDLANELRYVIGEGPNALISVAVIGVNTDDDSITVHGKNGEVLKVVDFMSQDTMSGKLVDEVCVS